MVIEATSITLPEWEVVRKLGEGSFGGVYEIQRTQSSRNNYFKGDGENCSVFSKRNNKVNMKKEAMNLFLKKTVMA